MLFQQHGDSKQFLCKCSFLEIYNEQIFDLMEPTAIPLHLRESFKTGVYVAGLAEKVVADASEAYGVGFNQYSGLGDIDGLQCAPVQSWTLN